MRSTVNGTIACAVGSSQRGAEKLVGQKPITFADDGTEILSRDAIPFTSNQLQSCSFTKKHAMRPQ